MRGTVDCVVCAKPFFGYPGDACISCEAIVRAWVARGFLDMCRYLEKVSKFEAYVEAHQESSDDPTPAADE